MDIIVKVSREELAELGMDSARLRAVVWDALDKATKSNGEPANLNAMVEVQLSNDY